VTHRAPLYLLCLIALFFILCGCGAPAGEAGAGAAEKVKVVATIFPLADIIENIGGETVEVTLLLGPGDSPHTFEPTVEQARAVAEADLLFFIGEGLDDWAVKLAAAEGKPAIQVTERLEEQLLRYTPLHLAEEDHEAAHDHHPHSTRDPHVWTDPLLVYEAIAPLVAQKLSEAAPRYKDNFDQNLELYRVKLDGLHRELTELIAGFSQKKFITYHSAWGYFARRYGLEEVAAVEQYPGQEPSAQWLIELVRLAEEHRIKAIFAEPQLSRKAAAVIAGEIGGKVLYLDPLGGKEIDGRDSYINLMRYNAGVFQQALQ